MELQATAVFDYPTIAALAGHLATFAHVAAHQDDHCASTIDMANPTGICSLSNSEARQTIPLVTIAAVAGVVPGSNSIGAVSQDSSARKYICVCWHSTATVCPFIFILLCL